MSKLDEPSSSLLFCSTCKASWLLYKDTWAGGVVMGETHLLSQAGACHHCPLPLKSLCSPRWREDRESSVSCVLSACCACLRGDRVPFQWSLPLLHSMVFLRHLSSSMFPPELCLGSCVDRGGCRACRLHDFLPGGCRCPRLSILLAYPATQTAVPEPDS